MDLTSEQKQLLIDLIFDKEIIYESGNETHEQLGDFKLVRQGEDEKTNEVGRLFPTTTGIKEVLRDIDPSLFKLEVPETAEPLYTAKVIKEVYMGRPYWKTLIIGVFYEGKLIGKYYRNYSSFMETFYPFKWKDNWYAVYSKDYACTRLMKLPECEDIGGEEPHGFGFCPVELYVPSNPNTGNSEGFGFVAGCVWGDDTSWKIQFLDLRERDKGILKRDERFGYIELPDDSSLEDAVMLDNYWWFDLNEDQKDEKRKIDPIEDNRWIKIKLQEHFRLRSGKRERDDDED